MDQHHARSFAKAGPAPVHHALMIAGAAAQQAGSRTAIIAERLAHDQPVHADTTDALAAIFTADGRPFAPLLGGSFHPHIAQARVSAGHQPS